MNRSIAIGILTVLSLLTVAATAQTNLPGFPLGAQSADSAAYAELDRLIEVISLIVDPVREAHYAAAQGCNASTSAAMNLHAQMVLNVLIGPGTPLYEDTSDSPHGVERGVLPIVREFEFSDGWDDPEVTTALQKQSLEGQVRNLRESLDVLSQRAQQVLDENIPFVEKRLRIAAVSASLDELLMMIESLLASYGYEIRLSPDESLQAAIDRARDGSTIYLWPQTYTEPVRVSKNLTLVGAIVDSNPLFESSRFIYGSVIGHGLPDTDGIKIHSDRPIQVTLRDLTVADAPRGISISGGAVAVLESVTVRDSGTAIDVSDKGLAELFGCEFRLNNWVIHTREGGSVVGSECVFSDNRKAVAATFSSSCSLTDCLIERCGVPDDDTIASAGVITAYCSDVVLERCIIRDNYGRGVLLGGGKASKLHMTDCLLTNNEIGLSLTYGGCNPHLGDNWEHGNEGSHGTISGWSNHIPSPGEPDGNRLVSIEYYYPQELDPHFLLEPEPKVD